MRAVVAAGAALAVALAGAGPAAAAADQTTLTLSGPAYQALRHAHVAVGAVAPATGGGRSVTWPVSGLTPLGTDSAVVAHKGGLRLRAGGRSVTMSTPSIVVGPRSDVTVHVGGKRPVVFTVAATGSRRHIDATTGAISVTAAPVTLTAAGAELLRRRLDRPAIRPGRIGTLRLATDTTVTGMPGFASVDGPPTPGGASLTPRPEGAVSVTGGTVSWAVRRSWLGYLEQGGGATGADGAVFDQGTEAFRLPISGGWFDRATGRAVITTTGATQFQYLDHQIDISMTDWAYDLAGEKPKAVATIKTALHAVILPGPSIIGTRQPILFAKTDGIAPAVAADGAAVSWTDVPLTLTNEGIAMFLVYPYDSEQGRLSITATLG